MLTTAEIGRELVTLCKHGKNLEAIDKFYGAKIVSIEVHGTPELPSRMEGIEAIRGKNNWWFANHTYHSGDAIGPFPKDDKFIVLFKMDVTAKAGPMAGQRMQLEEAGLYTVKDGKIVQEEFFYDMPG